MLAGCYRLGWLDVIGWRYADWMLQAGDMLAGCYRSEL